MTDKKRFIEFLVQQNVLKFGRFTLNSGRVSPYFLTSDLSPVAGPMRNLARLRRGRCNPGWNSTCCSGRRTKAYRLLLPLQWPWPRGVDVGVAYNRKEAKDHGEGGLLVGAPVSGRVLMLDDVLTSGKAIRGAANLIRSEDAEIAGVVIAMDRAEVMAGSDETAVSELRNELAAPVISIAHVSDVLAYLSQQPSQSEALDAMQVYVEEHCAL